MEAGSVGHSKPLELLGSVSTGVSCLLYHQLDPGEYWELHRDAEKVDGPVRVEPWKGQ